MAVSGCALYQPHVPQATPLYRLVEAHYGEVRDEWEEQYEGRYGSWRPFMDKAVGGYLDCGSMPRQWAVPPAPGGVDTLPTGAILDGLGRRFLSLDRSLDPGQRVTQARSTNETNDTPHPPTVCVVGQHQLDYPRNVVNQRLMRASGYAITLCHSRASWLIRSSSIVAQYLGAARRAQVVFATEGSHRHVLWLKLATLWTGQKIVFDPFISLFNTEVEDRKQHAPTSLSGRLAKWRDYVSCHAADYLVFDTDEHKDYFFARYGLNKPYRILRVGVDEAVFQPRPALPRAPGQACEVLFYGTYIPLQGIDVIVAAADRLRGDPSIVFTLVGDGQEYPRIRAVAEPLKLPNLHFVPPMPPTQLAERIARADICLGIFDTEIKASQVIPNKVVQCAAMNKAIITRRSRAIARYFEDQRSVRLIDAGDPAALADAIVELAQNHERATLLGSGARAVFERHFSVAAQTELMRTLLDEASVTP